jgi:ribosome-associated protein
LKSQELAMVAMEAAIEKKALNPVLIDVGSESSYTDFVLVLSGRSDRHVDAVADAILQTMKKEQGLVPIGVEGQRDGQWSLIDFGDVVVHVFYHPLREFYDLEGLWINAPRVPIEVPEDSQLHLSDAYGS